MDLHTAHALLGARVGCSPDEARAAYRGRCRLLHPDRVTSDLRESATDAMAQLNEAWELVRAAQAGERVVPLRPSTRASATRTAPTPPRARATVRRGPRVGECVACGSGPARPIRVHQVTARLVRWRYRSSEDWLCRDCGLSAYRDAQAHTLARGWWGLAAWLLAAFAVMANRVNLSSHRSRTKPVAFRRPEVETPYDAPRVTPRVAARRGPWIAGAAALGLVLGGLVVASEVQSRVASVASCDAAAGVMRDAGLVPGALPTGARQEALDQLHAELGAQGSPVVAAAPQVAAVDPATLTDGIPGGGLVSRYVACLTATP